MPARGVFQLETTGNKGVAVKQVTDGMSNTLMVGEKHVRIDGFGQGVPDSSLYNGDTLSPVRPAGTMYPLAVSDYDYGWKFGSYHPGVCQFVLGDGSVRAISDGIDGATLGRLADRSDGQIIGDF